MLCMIAKRFEGSQRNVGSVMASSKLEYIVICFGFVYSHMLATFANDAHDKNVFILIYSNNIFKFVYHSLTYSHPQCYCHHSINLSSAVHPFDTVLKSYTLAIHLWLVVDDIFRQIVSI